jgi:uncharacterized protein (DUF4415 family)
MSGAPTGKTSKKTEPRTDWRRLRSMTDAQVHAAVTRDPDINPTDEAFWMKAKIVMPRHKKTVTMRLDADILDWFRSNRGYQTRINAILRAYMNATSPATRGTRSGKGHSHHSGR